MNLLNKILSTAFAIGSLVAVTVSIGTSLVLAEAAQVTNPDEAVGTIATPTPNSSLVTVTRIGNDGIPIYPFVSWGLTIFTIIAGVWVLYNIVFAAFTYLGANGDAAAHQKVRTEITNSIIGILVIVLAYTITAIVSTMLFGSPDFFFNPQLQGIV